MHTWLYERPIPKTVGNKFSSLMRLSDRFLVPSAICISDSEIRNLLLPKEMGLINALLSEFDATRAANTFDISAQIVNVITTSSSLEVVLRHKLEPLLMELGNTQLYAVRSSSCLEDRAESALAGYFLSKVPVNQQNVISAIIEVWASQYSTSVLVHKARYKSPDCFDMAVFIQSFIEPLWSGVCFANSQKLLAFEVTPGRLGPLVDGAKPPTTNFPNNVQQFVSDMAIEIAQINGYTSDIEWAWDGSKVWLLQARPATEIEEVILKIDKVEVTELYKKGAHPSYLGDVEKIYSHYVSKRAQKHRKATLNGASSGGAWVIVYTKSTLRTSNKDLLNILENARADDFVLDFHENVRQIIVSKKDIFNVLERFACGHNITAAILREFIVGDFGLISWRVLGATMLEVSADGLLPLNRGLAEAHQIVYTDDSELHFGRSVPKKIIRSINEQVSIISRFTKVVASDGTAQLEWSIAYDSPYFIDYSTLQNKAEDQDDYLYTTVGRLIMSKGSACGPVIIIHDDTSLVNASVGPAINASGKSDARVEQLDAMQELRRSISRHEHPPIVFAPRPLAVYAMLTNEVSGFVFKHGSLLCHLAITLREQGIPAMEWNEPLPNKTDWVSLTPPVLEIEKR